MILLFSLLMWKSSTIFNNQLKPVSEVNSRITTRNLAKKLKINH